MFTFETFHLLICNFFFKALYSLVGFVKQEVIKTKSEKFLI